MGRFEYLMTLEKLIGRSLTLAPLVLLAAGVGCKKEEPNLGLVPHFDVQYDISDTNGYAHFTDTQSGEDFSLPIYSENTNGTTIPGALVMFFDGENSDVFYSEHPDYNTPGFDIFASANDELNSSTKRVSSSAGLTMTSNTWQGWTLTENNGSRHEAARDLVDWATKEKNNGWDYFGCTTFEEMEDGHKFFSVLYAGISKLAPVAAVMSYSETITTALEIVVGELETKEAEECEAFQFFGFIPNMNGWVTPTGGIVIPFCYTPKLSEIYTDNGIDDDCNGEIDEGGSGTVVVPTDTGEPGTGTSMDCSDARYLCDDFEDGLFDNSLWTINKGSVNETGGMLKFDDYSEISSYFLIDLTTLHEYSFKLLSEIVAGDDYEVVVTKNDWGWIAVTNRSGSIYASCYNSDIGDMVYSEQLDLVKGTRYNLELAVSDSHSSAFINDSILFTQDGCWLDNVSFSTDELELLVRTGYGTGVELENISVDEF